VAIVKPAIERKLSSLLGAAVTFDELKVSLIGGSIEGLGVTIRGVDASVPFVTIARVRADVAVTRALKGEIVIKSLAIERPVVTFVRTARGVSNFPHRPSLEFHVEEEPSEEKTSWKFDVEKILLVDGKATVTLEDGYELSSGRVLGQLNREGDDYTVTLLAEGVSRTDQAVDVGTVGVAGRITHAPTLVDILTCAGLNLDIQIGELAQIRYSSPTMRPQDGRVEFEGKLDLKSVLSLLPPRGHNPS
jgi:uncharacterized protein involved in outer membrane biogenesis